MRFLWFMVFSVVALLIKENSCVPAIRPLSQRGIIFPVDNWDNCYMDDASTRPGLCKKLEECPDILKKWDKENAYPKTCYFIKKQQFVCCPIPASNEVFTSSEKPHNIFTEKPDNSLLDIFNTEPGIFGVSQATKDASTYSNIFLDKVKNKTTTTSHPWNIFLNRTTTTSTERPSNIFLDKFNTTSTTERPGNIFLQNLNTQKPNTQKPPFDIFITDQPTFIKRRSETECDIQNPQKFDSIDVNGSTSGPTEFPFMAVLGWRSEIDNKLWYPCGGVLISPKFVLTAGHCAEIGGISPSFVHLGDQDLGESENGTIKIKRFIIHPSYNETTIDNDIALVELEEEVSNPRACLWTQPDFPIAKLIALGYGHISFGSISSNQLFQTSLTLIDNKECQETYKLDDKFKNIRIMNNHLCAGDLENFRHFCQGDTGGPLIVELENVIYVVGITAFGLGCAELPPSIFTRVSVFVEWIEPIVWPEIDVRIDGRLI